MNENDETQKFKDQSKTVEGLTGKKLAAGDWCNILTGECFRRDEDGNVTKLEGDEAIAVLNAILEDF